MPASCSVDNDGTYCPPPSNVSRQWSYALAALTAWSGTFQPEINPSKYSSTRNICSQPPLALATPGYIEPEKCLLEDSTADILLNASRLLADLDAYLQPVCPLPAPDALSDVPQLEHILLGDYDPYNVLPAPDILPGIPQSDYIPLEDTKQAPLEEQISVPNVSQDKTIDTPDKFKCSDTCTNGFRRYQLALFCIHS